VSEWSYRAVVVFVCLAWLTALWVLLWVLFR